VASARERERWVVKYLSVRRRVSVVEREDGRVEGVGVGSGMWDVGGGSVWLGVEGLWLAQVACHLNKRISA